MIKRKMYKYLINWKQKKDKSALIIKGARQVGKSLVEMSMKAILKLIF